MKIINMKKLTIIASMLLAAGAANAAGEGTIDLASVTTMFLAGVAVITTFVGAAGLGKAGLGVVVWGWRKAVSMVSGK
ncbi:hypothetical protein [Aeromonas tecta]|uniref:hypothetical protein n=1 Tax=Aeromonas tecta TaxID=324617 RepID=UPI000681941E|nr:hypothetical protein [Aeromonas tecta]